MGVREWPKKKEHVILMGEVSCKREMIYICNSTFMNSVTLKYVLRGLMIIREDNEPVYLLFMFVKNGFVC